MKSLLLMIVSGSLVVAAGCDEDRPPASANASQEAAPAAPASDQKFVQAFVEAVNSNAPSRLRALVHASCLSRIDDSNQVFIDQMLERDVQRRIPPRYEAKVTPIGSQDPLPFEGMVHYPVRPTHQVRIDFEGGPQRGTTILRHAIQDDAGWWLVLALPSKETLEQIKANRSEPRP